MNNIAAIATSFSSLTGGAQLPLTIQFGHPPFGSLTATDKCGTCQQHAPLSAPSVVAATSRTSTEGGDRADMASEPQPSLSEPPPPIGTACSSTTGAPSLPLLPALPPAFRLLALHTIEDLWRTWMEGMNGQPAVAALEKDWGKDWRREGPVGRWFSARRPLIEKIQVHVSQGRTVQAAISLVEMERGSRSLDRFYKDVVRERNGRVVVPRRRREVAV